VEKGVRALFGGPQPPRQQEISVLPAVAGLLAVLSVVLYLALRPGKDDTGD
jgi:hypothetical protein